MKALRIAVFALGCRVNHFEALALSDRIEALGATAVSWNDKADAGILNSCALTALAEKKTRRAIKQFARLNPESPVAITGCCAEADLEAAARIPGVRWVVPNSAKMSAADIVIGDLAARYPQEKVFSSAPSESLCASSPLGDRTNLKIQDGCNNACSYCIIPRLRGRPKSRVFSEILSDAENMVERGVAEIVVTGINISKFESECGGLVGLLDALNSVPGLKRFRIGSIEPHGFPFKAVEERMADPSHKLCPHMHISAQSLNDAVLNAMNRKYASDEITKLVECARNLCPDISIGADIICGHPGEGEREFLDTLSKATSCGFSYLHAFTFSPRPKTRATAMDGQVPCQIRALRAQKMRALSERLSREFCAAQFGKTRRLLLENDAGEGIYYARSDNYMRCRVPTGRLGMRNALVEAVIGKQGDGGRIDAEFLREID